jgi:hypothetical protein
MFFPKKKGNPKGGDGTQHNGTQKKEEKSVFIN